MAHKKAGGSSRNGRDSARPSSRRQEVRRSSRSSPATSSSASAARNGTPGANVGMGKDHTLFATADGRVRFLTRQGRAFVSVSTGPRGRRINGESETKELPPASHRPGGSKLQLGPIRPSSRSERQGRWDATSLRRFLGLERAHRIGARPCFPTSPVTMFPAGNRRLWLRWPPPRRRTSHRAPGRRESCRGDDGANSASLRRRTRRKRFVFMARHPMPTAMGCSSPSRRKGGRTPDRRASASVRARTSGRPHLGYWLGIPSWGQGYATEAARALIDAFFAYGDGTRAHGLGAGHQPGLPPRAREMRLRLQGSGLIELPARGRTLPVEHFRLDRRAWESLKTWGHSGLVPDPGRTRRGPALAL